MSYEWCAWEQDEKGISHTSCGKVFAFKDKRDGSRAIPSDFGYRYCPWCGKLIVLFGHVEVRDAEL